MVVATKPSALEDDISLSFFKDYAFDTFFFQYAKKLKRVASVTHLFQTRGDGDRKRDEIKERWSSGIQSAHNEMHGRCCEDEDEKNMLRDTS